MSVVSLKNITYSVEDEHSKELISILEDVNLQVAVGEFHLITGPSGSGKTTLLQIIATILQPTAGELTLFERNVTRNNYSSTDLFVIRPKIGFLFQSVYLPENLTVKEYLEVQTSLSNIGLISARSKFNELLSQFGISSILNCKPSTLSGGEKQRVALVGLLARDIELLLLDEPTGSLDYENRKNLWELIFKLKKKLTIIAVTHDESIVSKVDVHHKLDYGHLL